MSLVTPLFAGVVTLSFIALSVGVMLARRKLKISVGDGNNPKLMRLMRVQGNFAEYMPFAMVLMWMLEVSGVAGLWLAVLALVLLFGRMAHIWGVLVAEPQQKDYRFRVLGMMCTWTPLGVMAFMLIWLGL